MDGGVVNLIPFHEKLNPIGTDVTSYRYIRVVSCGVAEWWYPRLYNKVF